MNRRAVLRWVPIAVFAWSPKNVPRNCIPVSRMPLGDQNATEPYVFFRLLVTVLAPRFTHRPRYECPTKPSCDLFAWPRKTVVLTSPWTRQWSPTDVLAILPPPTVVSSPT